jgi:hypothetical protein
MADKAPISYIYFLNRMTAYFNILMMFGTNGKALTCRVTKCNEVK